MKIYLVRHGDKEKGEYYNEQLKIHDYPLSQKGIAESEKLCDYFDDVEIDEIIVSQYSRALDTIKKLAGKKNIPIKTDPRLNEINNGLIEKMKDEEIRLKYPDVWYAYTTLESDFRWPGGESGDEALSRIKSLLDEKKNNVDKTVLLCAHEGLMRITMCYIFGLPSYKRFNMVLDFCGIMELEYDYNRDWWKLIRFNQKCK